jgi:L-seryl-tRNA(Ser) seleniumtransferase
VCAALSDWLAAARLQAELIDGESTIGGGSLPGETLPTTLIALSCPPEGGARNIAAVQAALRAAGVVARVKDDRVLLDLRTVFDDAALVACIRASGLA